MSRLSRRRRPGKAPAPSSVRSTAPTKVRARLSKIGAPYTDAWAAVVEAGAAPASYTGTFEAAAGELEPHVRLLKLNADQAPDLSNALGVRAIPTLIVFRGGKEIARSAGAMSRPALVDWTRRALAVAA